jgi:hypothetical protein
MALTDKKIKYAVWGIVGVLVLAAIIAIICVS